MSSPTDPDKHSDDISLPNGSIYKDIPNTKDIPIKISSTNKDSYTPQCTDSGKDRTAHSGTYDYMSLRNILREEMDKRITIEQAEQIGNALINLFGALYFDDN